MKTTIKTLAIILIGILMISLCACKNTETKTDGSGIDKDAKPMCLYCGSTLTAWCSTHCSVCNAQVKNPYLDHSVHAYDDRDICINCGEGKLQHWADGYNVPD